MNAPTGADSRLPLPIGWTPADAPPADGVTGATATVVPVRVVGPDGSPGWLFTVTGDVGNAVRKRLRSEQPALDALLRAVTAEPAGAVLLPWLEYGDPKAARPYLVCPRPGPTFADDLLRGPMPATRVVRSALVCVDALHVLHRNGRAHGLLAPQSLHHDGDLIRLSAPLPPALAELVALAGGTGHEPPEVLRGGDADPAADVFGLASTCWTLLSGRPPFGPVGDQLARLTAAEPPPLSRADVPSAMEAALRAALSPDPARRPDLRTLAQALRIVDGGAAPVSEVAPRTQPAVPSGAGGADDPGARLDTLAPTRPVTDAGRPLGSRYLLDSLIGRGATGHVWRGHVRDEGSPVAVKLLRPELAEDPEVVTRFMRERAALMRLSHPYLVGIHDLVAEGGALAIVMDFVDGRDLRAVLGSGPPAPLDAARLLGQTAEALAAVHAAGIVHRDLKPENVLVEPVGGTTRARLTDFGLARAVESSALTRMTQLVGTPAYVAPEVVAGREPGPAVDVYALGITAYELLAGRRPFAMTSTAALLHAHLQAVPERPDGLADDVWALVAACLDKDPARRPSASDVAQAWSRVAAGGPAGAVAHAPSSPAPVPPGAGHPIETPLRQYPGPSPVLPGAPTPAELRSSTGVQETTTTERPLAPRHSGPAPEGRDRRKLWWALAAAVVVLGFGGGFGVVALGGDDEPAAKPATEQPAYYLKPTIASTSVGLGIRWSVPSGAVSESSVFFVVDYANDRTGRPLNRTPLPFDQRSFNDGSLKAGQCVAVYILGPAVRAPKANLTPIPGCVPAKSTPTGSPSK